MQITLTDRHHRQLDVTIDHILEAHAKKKISLPQARAAIAHIIAAAALGNEQEVRDWLTPDRVTRWRNEIKAGAG
jgi:hypothetical protein